MAIVTGPRSPQPMGLELAEGRLFAALRSMDRGVRIDVRVVGRRQALRHARSINARWVPSIGGRIPVLATADADLVHLIGLDLRPPRHKRFVATVHDVSALYFEDEGDFPPWFDEILGRASLLLTPSEFTARELASRFGVSLSRIRVFGGAPVLEARYAPPLSRAELASLGIEPPLILRYGGYTHRKNVRLLLEAWGRVSDGTLVLAGPPQPARARLLAQASTLERVVVLDYTPPELLKRLLRSAAAFVSPSLYEGYGLPPLEALAAGTPVVAVASGSLHEVCNGAVATVENDPDRLAAAIGEVIKDERLSQRLRSQGLAHAVRFTWPLAAKKVLAAYTEADR